MGVKTVIRNGLGRQLHSLLEAVEHENVPAQTSIALVDLTLMMSSPIVERQETPGMMPHQKFEGHNSSVFGATHLPGGQRTMADSLDGSLRVWNLKSGKQIGNDWWDGDSSVCTIALSLDGKKVVSGSQDGGVRLWDMDTGKVIVKWMEHTKAAVGICWSGNGQRVLSRSDDGTARQWDVESGEANLIPIKTGHEYVLAVVHSPDVSIFATSRSEQHAKIWDGKTGKLAATVTLAINLIAELLVDRDTSLVEFIAISPNGRILTNAFFDSTARLWNLDNDQPIDGKLLVTGCVDQNTLMLHHIQSVSQSLSPSAGCPMVFLTTYQIGLNTHRMQAPFVADFPLCSTLTPTIRLRNPVLSTGFEIVSLGDQPVKISGFANVPQQ
ncbi:WD40 repeat-like protein [Suillus hirtellus]|nr:WD40 repeat-like protein [Suillus hirtellus]